MDLSEDGLNKEVRAAEQNRSDYLHKYRDNLRSYHGPAFHNGSKCKDEILNPVYESVVVQLPRLAYARPKIRAAGKVAMMNVRSLEHPLSKADELQHKMNQWAKDNRIEKVLRGCAVDFTLAQSALVVTREPYNGFVPEPIREKAGGQVFHPKLHRIDPEYLFFDPLAIDPLRRRYIGHGAWQDINSLIDAAKVEEADGWDMKVLQDLKKEVSDIHRTTDGTNQSVRRNDVYVRQMWVPEAEVEGSEGPGAGFHGAIYTLVARDADQNMRMARKPQAYYGPKTGPYSIFGAYPVSGTTYSLSTAVATRPINDKTNYLARSLWLEAKNAKKFIVVGNHAGNLKSIIKNVKNGQVVSINVDEINKSVQSMSIGGPDGKSVDVLKLFQEIRDRQSGLDSQQMGAVDPGGTATASMIANNSAEQIGAYQDLVFQEGVLNALETAAWYFYTDEAAPAQLGADVSQDLGLSEKIDLWSFAEPDGVPFEVMELVIELDSMGRGGDVQRRGSLVEALAMIQNFAAAAAQFPGYADWERMAKSALETLNLSALASSINFNQGAAESPGEPQGGGGFDRAPNQNGGGAGQAATLLPQQGALSQ